MKIIKRSGTEAVFDISKIIIAINKANHEVVEAERLTADQIKEIAQYIEDSCKDANHALNVEDIQDLVEDQLMDKRAFSVARKYITYRYKRALVRKSNSTDEQILSLIECNNEEVKQENSNKDSTVNSVQRDYMAGEVSKDITRRFLLPEDIVEAHEQGIIHFHDADYFAQHMHNCDLVNLEDMLQNGTVISGTRIDKPHSFSTACNIATQIIAQVASSQYGGQSISLSHLAPFVDIRQPQIELHTSAKSSDDVQGDVSGQTDTDVTISEERTEQNHEKVILEVETYSVTFDRQIMEEVAFSMEAGGKVAIVGPNGTGKTTILRDIYKNNNPAIKLAPDLKIAYLSQMHGEVFNEKETVLKNFEDAGFETEAEIVRYLKTYGFEEELVYNKVENLSGGEKNLLQLAKISRMDADFLLLDEPTSHLDTYSQLALEQAIEKYEGAVLMVSHDFYTVANCMDYVLFVEEKKLRKMSIRKFRKMIYADHFDKNYLELEQKKKELENRISFALQTGKFEEAGKYCDDLEQIINQM